MNPWVSGTAASFQSPSQPLSMTWTPAGGSTAYAYGSSISNGGAAAPAAPAPSQYQGQMNSFLSQQAPQFQAPQYQGPGPNRFETGLAANERRLNALQDDPSSIQQTAAYKFRVGQGQEALQRQQAAKGMLGSGNRLMELTKYGQDMGSQEYDAQHKRLADLTGMYAGNWNQAQGTNVQEALGKYSTGMQGALGSYGTAMQGHTARGNTLANLLSNDQSNQLAQQKFDWSQQQSQPQQQTFSTRTLRGGGTGTFW